MDSNGGLPSAESMSDSPVVDSLWRALAGRELGDELLEWAPDLFAFTDVVLERSEAYRFAVSAPDGRAWPPQDTPDWHTAIAATASDWCAWAETGRTKLPRLVSEEWTIVLQQAATPLDDLASGHAWRLCEALLTLHAVADEACAGTGVAVEVHGDGHRFRARARELLARTGSLSRVSRHRLRVLPRVRNVAGGISFRSLSRYVCVRGPSVDAVWNRVPTRQPGRASSAQQANVVLLPWPLRVDEGDFRPLGPVERADLEPYGFFEFAPGETLDLDMADRVLTSARNEADSVDVVVLPEGALEPADVDELESLLTRHRVTLLVAGVREAPGPSGRLGANWLHLGVWFGGRWWHYRQNKHHRWFLDENQIDQYHLARALPPAVRWWEAMEVPRRAVQLLELGEGITLVSLVCEDLARLDEVADLLRAIGPTLVVAILLDGPQLASRWTARYASVLADDPGSAVLTLSSFGFVQRSLPSGRPPSAAVSLWKDPVRGFREIPLEPDAHGVLIATKVGRTTRRSADGRRPVANVADLRVTDVRQIRAAQTVDHITDAAAPGRSDDQGPAAPLRTVELTILTSWAEAVAEALSASPDRVDAVLEDARADAAWRERMGVEEPSPELAAALGDLAQMVEAPTRHGSPSIEAVLAAIDERPRIDGLGGLVRAVLRSRLEWRRSSG